MKKISVGIISDIACPWCYIGRQRLQKALNYFASEYEISVHWKPFELFPLIPAGGWERKPHMVSVFGSESNMNTVFADVQRNARKEGLSLHFDKIPVSVNTFPLHRLIWKAKELNKQDEVATVLFDGFFTRGVNMSSLSNVVDLMKMIGWETSYTKSFLQGEEGVEEVRAGALACKNLGVSSVPYYLINDTIAVSGAQEPEVFIDEISKALKLHQQ